MSERNITYGEFKKLREKPKTPEEHAEEMLIEALRKEAYPQRKIDELKNDIASRSASLKYFLVDGIFEKLLEKGTVVKRYGEYNEVFYGLAEKLKEE